MLCRTDQGLKRGYGSTLTAAVVVCAAVPLAPPPAPPPVVLYPASGTEGFEIVRRRLFDTIAALRAKRSFPAAGS